MKGKFNYLLLVVFVFMMTSFQALAQSRLVSGVVLDDSNAPLPGAGVVVAGTRNGVITDLDGKFSIQAAPGDKLSVSFLGYQTVTVSASSTNLSIVLNPDSNFLQETVVIGYGTQKKATLTGAVSAVTNSEIAVTKNENVINMLSGKVPGLRVTQNSSQPGAFDNKIDIRGMGTPLIVVDGIPRDQAYFSRMDANEIDNISVLKDASAAIYGVRAANGVILVTTKHGSTLEDGDKFDVTLSGNYGFQDFLYLPKTADAVTHMTLINEKVFNEMSPNYPSRSLPKYTEEQIEAYRSGAKSSTNWSDEIFKKFVPQSQYNLSVNGSSKRIDYFFNLGYMKQEGSYKSGSLNYSRWNFRSNVDARITDHLTASFQLSGYTDETNQPNTKIWTVYKYAWTYRPTSQAWIDGNHDLPGFDNEMIEAENPVASTDSKFTGYRQEKRYNFDGSASLKFDIPHVEGLNLKAFYNYNFYTTDNSQYLRVYYLYARDGAGDLQSFIRNSPGSVRRQANPSNANTLQLSVNYDHTFVDAHHVSAMLLYEESYNKWNGFYAQRETFLDNEYLFAGEDENQVGAQDGVGDMSRRGIVGRAAYDYKSKYIVDFSFRYDSSSRFPKASRWGFFPSVSAGWRISEESFVKDNAPWITNLKIRGSYGIMGDDASAGTYPPTFVGYELKPTSYEYYFQQGSLVTGVAPTSIPNPNLTWYTAETSNIGIDWNLWQQKFGGTVEAFLRRRSGLLATSSVVLPGIVGATMPQENLESDATFGWEVELSHYNKIGDFRYWVTGEISATKNRWITKLNAPAGNSMEDWRRTNVSGRNKDIWFSIEEGGRFDNYAQIQNHPTSGGGYWSGVLPGDYWYEDWNEDGVIDGNDMHPVATYNLPVFNYGITLGASWKGIDLSMNFQGAAGVYSSFTEIFTEVGPFNGGSALSIYTDRWRTVDPNADPWNPHTEWISGTYPATGHSFNSYATGIRNASYIRLKTLELGYSFPRHLLAKAKIKDLRVFVNGYNLLTFSPLKNIDPERPGAQGGANTSGTGILIYNYPVNRTVNFGASIKF